MKVATTTKPVKNLWGRSEKSMTTSTMFSYCYSLAKFFLDFGYEPRDELRFPAKKLKALWFSPPSVPLPDGGRDTNGPLPRIFMSKLLVDQMSTQTQDNFGRLHDRSKEMPKAMKQLARLFPNKVMVQLPQGETLLSDWKQQLKRDIETSKA